MKLATSYFYQIRNFKPYMIPFSTAMYDPDWFHDYQSIKHNFLDKNEVVNGLRISELVPNKDCANLCHGTDFCLESGPNECDFLKTYQRQLEEINYDKMIMKLQVICDRVQRQLRFKEEPIAVFMVYEVPSKLCSERQIIHKVMNDKGYYIEELKYPIKEYYL